MDDPTCTYVTKRPWGVIAQEAIAKLHASDWLAYIATTGAVGHLVHDLWRVAGSSNTIIGTEVLYHRSQMERFIGFAPDKFVSRKTAMHMASEAYVKARREAEKMDGPRRPVLGLGMTATVATGREKRGEHRVHIAVRTDEGFHHLHAVLEKGYRSREEEGLICDRLALQLLLRVTGFSDEPMPSDGVLIIDGDERGPCATAVEAECVAWRLRCLLIHSSEAITAFDGDPAHHSHLSPDGHLIYPGSFDPLHGGHEAVADLAHRMTGLEVVYQMNDRHPAKGKIPPEEILRRAAQFSFHAPVLLVRDAGLYIDKARLMPGFPFLLGVDAVLGLLDQKYYGGPMGLLETLFEFDQLGTRFYVVGREVEGHFMTLDDVPIPPRYAHLFKAVSGRWDISSTELRNKG